MMVIKFLNRFASIIWLITLVTVLIRSREHIILPLVSITVILGRDINKQKSTTASMTGIGVMD